MSRRAPGRARRRRSLAAGRRRPAAARGAYDADAAAPPATPTAAPPSPARRPPTPAPRPTCDNALQSYAPAGALPAPGPMPAGTYDGEIQERGRLIAGVSADTLLLGSRNPITGQIEGFDIDMVKRGRQGDLRRPEQGRAAGDHRRRAHPGAAERRASTSSPAT